MTYQVIQEFKLKGAVQSLGSFINLSEQSAVKLKGFVKEVSDDQTAAFEKEGDPVSCRFWYQVCWAVQLYQNQCTRDTGCRVYKYLIKATRSCTQQRIEAIL